jgi:hypothetical protein
MCELTFIVAHPVSTSAVVAKMIDVPSRRMGHTSV